MMKMPSLLALVAAAALLASCGGGDGGSYVSSVKVVGDSLSDGGTFGAKATVQGANRETTRLWVDNVATAAGHPSPCARYTASSSGPVLNPAATACTNYAIGGGVVNVPGTGAADQSPLSIVRQLRDLATGSAFTPDDVLLITGGGNDAAALFTRYLAASSDGGASYVALLSELLTPAQVNTAATGGAASLAAAGSQYSAALADMLADAITADALNKGARRVVVANMPNIVLTPRFQAVLAAVAASSGGGAAGAAASNQLAAMANGWVQAFNARLSARLAADSRVLVIDFYALLNGWVANPGAAGLSNVNTPACPVTGRDSSGLPSYSLSTCTEAALSAQPPSGGSADWWRTYLFSDNFHATPYGNRLMSDNVLSGMRARGWL